MLYCFSVESLLDLALFFFKTYRFKRSCVEIRKTNNEQHWWTKRIDLPPANEEEFPFLTGENFLTKNAYLYETFAILSSRISLANTLTVLYSLFFLGWEFGLAVRLLVGVSTAHITMPSSKPGSASNSSFQLLSSLEVRRWGTRWADYPPAKWENWIELPTFSFHLAQPWPLEAFVEWTKYMESVSVWCWLCPWT